MNKLLTICIPTRNRVNSINKNIKYLHSLIIKRNLSKSINVLISDNSTSENYKKILKPEVKYFKLIHSADKGHDINILHLLDNAESKYIWLCQDHTQILENSLIDILKKISFTNLDYIFLSTKNNFRLNKIIYENKKFISFKNIYLNTNLVKLKPFKKEYKKILEVYNGSHLVFHFAIISLCFNAYDFEIAINLKRNSNYKFFDVNDEHNKMTWSKNLYNYINILNHSSNFYDFFLKNNPQYKKKINKIFNIFENSIPTLYRIIQLIKTDKVLSNYNLDFINHPTFNIYEKIVLSIIFKYKIKFIAKYPIKLFIIDLYYILFLPRQYISRLIKKTINFF
jgi:hypothetical protein